MLFKSSLKKELLVNSVTALLVLMSIVMAQRITFYLRYAAKGAIPNDSIITILGLNLIKYSPLLLSLSIFLAVLLTLSRWYRNCMKMCHPQLHNQDPHYSLYSQHYKGH